MIETRPSWTPGPPPPADGLREAFRRADQRRAGKALGLTVPTLAAVAAVIVASLPGVNTSSLRVTPADGTSGSPVAQAPVAAQPTKAPSLPGQAGAGGQVSAVEPPKAQGPAVAKPGGTTHIGQAALPQFGFDAARSARATMDLRSPRHPDIDGSSLRGGRTYRGLWIVTSRGAVAAAVLEIVRADGSAGRRYTTAAAVLPAGHYTVYVLGDAPVRVSVPLAAGEGGLKVHASRAVVSTYRTTTHSVTALEQAGTVSVRTAVPKSAAAVGFGGGFYSFPGGGTASFDLCLPHHGAACAASDPQESQGPNIQVKGGSGMALSLTRALVAQGRDVLLSAQVRTTGNAVLTSWSFTVNLS
ncbi:MAG: hypothetical protein QOJ92_1545 [Frankiales bacterium]|nr:hypothetical protein [Frankiales bacterium]